MMKDRGITCLFCGDLVNPDYGMCTCPECNREKCVESCIPGGVNTLCISCEEEDDV